MALFFGSPMKTFTLPIVYCLLPTAYCLFTIHHSYLSFAHMKRIPLYALLLFLLSCNDEDNQASPESVHDAAGMFINNVLDGKFDEARKLMVQDSENAHWLNETEKKYIHLSQEDKRNMRESDPTIYETKKQSDSVSIIYYSNSYNNRKDSLKLVKQSGDWKVDLKYTFPTADIPKNDQ